jgi:hypothetical protein
MAVRAQTGAWIYDVYVPYDLLFNTMAQHYAAMVMRKEIEALPVDAIKQREELERNLEGLTLKGAGKTADRIKLEGKAAIEFDQNFRYSKKQARARKPMITSLPGQAAKRSLLHE